MTVAEKKPLHCRVDRDVIAVAALTVLAAVLHVGVQSGRSLWLDEACTYWTIQTSVLDLLRGVRTDGSPPLYFLLVSAVSRVFGSSEFALRLASIAAATALVPACYAVARRFGSPRTALVAAALVATSPLVHYYSVEARAYAVLQLETAAILYAAFRAWSAPGGWRWWVALGFALALQLWTHTYAVFLVAVLPVIFWLASDTHRNTVALRAAAAAGGAALLALPVLLNSLRNTGSGVLDWVAVCWLQTPPSVAVLRSLEVFGFGGVYPIHLSSLGPIPSVRWLSVSVTAVLLLAATAPIFARERQGSPHFVAPRLATRALLSFLLFPLLAAWLYSLFVQPLYVVGRYDTMVLPVFLILMATGLENVFRLRRWLGILVCVVLAGFSAATFLAAASGTTPPPFQEDRMAAAHIASHAAPSDVVVTTGYRRAVVAYYLDRAGHAADVLSFPAEVSNHPGWYSADRLLAKREQLAQEGRQLATTLAWRARSGAGVWLVASGNNEVDEFLRQPLVGSFTPDLGRSSQEYAVLSLRLR
jgi:4-amino-4-deoxy-L-arabinose transferase-like glycosyltransferase